MRNDDGKTVYEKRNQNAYDENDRKVNQQNMNLHERQNFMDGKKVMTLPRSLAPSLPRSLSRARTLSGHRLTHLCALSCAHGGALRVYSLWQSSRRSPQRFDRTQSASEEPGRSLR